MDAVNSLAQVEGIVLVGVLGGAVLLFILAVVILVAKLMVVGNPSEMLIISGKRQKDGLGYRTLIGGRTMVIPIIEKVSHLLHPARMPHPDGIGEH